MTRGVFGPPGTEEWMAFFRDPDGNALALASRVVGLAFLILGCGRSPS